MKKIFTLLVAVYIVANCFATIRYVMPVAAGAGDGSSWANASGDLQGMIDSSSAGDSVWVAAGTYLPTTDPSGNASPTDPRNITFALKNGVKLYGSFAGNETLLSQRTLAVINANPSVLSGDIGTAGDSTDNCYHVVFSALNDSSTLLDGFTITKGNANGAGYYFVGSHSLKQFGGGGMINAYDSIAISNTIFTGNYAGSLGGGMYNTASSVTVSDCIFACNTSSDQGGGMDNEFASVINISNCVFYANLAVTGGGLLNEINAALNIYNSDFYGNRALSAGGGISGDSTTLTNCIVFGDTPGPNITAASYSIIEGSTVFPGIGNGNANPGFINAANPAGADSIWRTSDDGLQILPCSPAVDMGTETGAPPLDILGNARYDVPGAGISPVDIGAYENQQNKIIADVTVNEDTLTADSATGISCQWVTCPGYANAPGVSTNRTYVITASGGYALIVTGGNCSDTSSCMQIPAGIKSNTDAQQNILVYPNPAHQYIVVQAPGTQEDWVTIYDILGKACYRQKLLQSSTINISNLTPGVYFVKAGQFINKLIVE